MHCKNYSIFHTRAEFRQFLLWMSMFSLPQALLMHIHVWVITSTTWDPSFSTGRLYQDVVQNDYWRTAGSVCEAQWPRIKDALQCLSEEYGWPDYLHVISTAEQGTYSQASGLWKWVWSTYSQVHWCSRRAVVALHTALTHSERL